MDLCKDWVKNSCNNTVIWNPFQKAVCLNLSFNSVYMLPEIFISKQSVAKFIILTSSQLEAKPPAVAIRRKVPSFKHIRTYFLN
jgi:hypothetical protein